MKKLLRNFTFYILPFTFLASCIEPPLLLPGEEIISELPMVLLDMELVWDVDADWEKDWHYGWDEIDRDLWGDIEYPIPSSYELRRYYLGNEPKQPHTSVEDFTFFGTRFRRNYLFGYYDMLLWSNIDSDDGTQVVVIDEKDLEEVKATTTVTRGMTRVSTATTVTQGTTILTGTSASTVVTGLYNQPEIFYSDYLRDLYISRDTTDYDYYDHEEKCWVLQLNSVLEPLVYIYLVQVIIYNNVDGRVIGTTGDNAISAFASGTSVNTGHTWDKPVMVYFGSRIKKDQYIGPQKVDIIGGKFTTYGLCDMDSFSRTRGSSQYTGSRTDLTNYLYVDLLFSNGGSSTLQIDVTEQCQRQAHGGIITVWVDANTLVMPPGPVHNPGSLFVPTVEDYDEIVYDIVM